MAEVNLEHLDNLIEETEKSQVSRMISISVISPLIVYFSSKDKLSRLDRFILGVGGIVVMVECIYAFYKTDQAIKHKKRNTDIQNLHETTLTPIKEAYLSQIVRLFDILVFAPNMIYASLKKDELSSAQKSILLSMASISIAYNVFYLIDYTRREDYLKMLNLIRERELEKIKQNNIKINTQKIEEAKIEKLEQNLEKNNNMLDLYDEQPKEKLENKEKTTPTVETAEDMFYDDSNDLENAELKVKIKEKPQNKKTSKKQDNKKVKEKRNTKKQKNNDIRATERTVNKKNENDTNANDVLEIIVPEPIN